MASPQTALAVGSFLAAQYTATFGATTLTTEMGSGADTFVMRVDSTGSIVWATQAALGDSRGIGITADCAGGDAYVTGRFDSPNNFFVMRVAVAGSADDFAGAPCHGNTHGAPPTSPPTLSPSSTFPASTLPAGVAQVLVKPGASINIRSGGTLIIGETEATE